MVNVDIAESKDYASIPIYDSNIGQSYFSIMSLENELTFSNYQAQSYKTAIYPESAKFIYPILGLIGEVGEVAEKVRDALFPAGKPRDWDDTSMFLKKIYHSLDDVTKTCLETGTLSKIVRDKNKELPKEFVQALREKVESISQEQINKISPELGDIGWFLSTSAGDINIKLGYIFQCNLDKLAKRKEKGTLSGSGDLR